MSAILIIAGNEIRDGLRNRWVAASVLLLAALALSLSFLGSAPNGVVKASPMSVTVASLSSLTVYLLPLIALMLSFDALVGEFERGTMLLLLTYPLARWQVVLGKFLGHTAILLVAIVVGFGSAGLLITFMGDADAQSGRAYLAMMGSSLLLGAAFVALGYLASALVRERATAVGVAIGIWLILVVLYDFALLGILLADEGQVVGQSTLSTLMLVNPTDAYRIFNLAGFEDVSLVSGMTGAADKMNAPLLLSVLFGWVVLPLTATMVAFQRREL